MSDPIILSDDEENQNAFATPFSTQLKKRRKGLDPTPGEVFIVDDDPTPQKSGPNSAPLFVIETPISSFEKSNVSIVKCTETPRDPNERVPVSDNQKFTGSRVHIFVSYDGVWDRKEDSWVYKNGSTHVFPMTKDVTYLQLVEKLYEVLVTDKLLLDLKLEVPYTCSGFPLAPALLATDKDVSVFVDEISTSIQHRIPLCVTPVRKYTMVNSFVSSDVNKEVQSDAQSFVLKHVSPNFGINRSICLESDSETENDHCGTNNWKENTVAYDSSSFRHSESSPPFHGRTDSIGADDISFVSGDRVNHPFSSESYIHQVDNDSDKQNGTLEASNIMQQKAKVKSNALKLKRRDDATGVKKATKGERLQLMEEKKMKKEQERLQKAALKAETAEIKKMEKEKKKWENGKFALKSIVAEIDTRVVEQGSIGGHLLSRFAEKGLAFRITSNTIEKSIIWSMTVPEEISQLYSKGVEIPYLLLVFEAEEFCNLVVNGSLMDHASRVQNLYPSHTICYLTNRLMAYINKREQEHYRNPNININWKRPPVEEALSKVAVHFLRVHSRQCIDEAEIAEHVAGLTCSLASCQFRKKLTRLSVHANGSVIPKDSVDKNLIKKNLWLKALVAIPKVQPRFALAIWKKYPTMKALLSVYMDPSISVHEKEFLLKDLTTEGLLGSDRRVGEICSKRVYRILMAQCGSIRTDDVEDGADFFSHNTS